LIVDIAAPEYETKVAILRKKAEERDQEFELSVAEALAKHPLSSVRQLAGALNKVLAIQEPEEAPVEGPITGQQLLDEFGSFMEELSHTVAHKVEREEEPWRRLLRETAEIFEKDGFSATRLRRILESDTLPADPQEVADQFRRDVARLRQVEKSLATAGNPWPEAAVCVLKDPERLDEAVSLLASAQERVRPFSRLGEGPFLANLESHYEAVVIKAAGKLITRSVRSTIRSTLLRDSRGTRVARSRGTQTISGRRGDPREYRSRPGASRGRRDRKGLLREGHQWRFSSSPGLQGPRGPRPWATETRLRPSSTTRRP
jgi:hypothetical protein